MLTQDTDVDQTLTTYNAAVDKWIAAIREEEALASHNSSLAQIDQWEEAHIREEAARMLAKDAKKDYEAALRVKFFHFS